MEAKLKFSFLSPVLVQAWFVPWVIVMNYLFCEETKQVLKIEVERNGIGLSGKRKVVSLYPHECTFANGAVLHSGCLYYSMKGTKGG